MVWHNVWPGNVTTLSAQLHTYKPSSQPLIHSFMHTGDSSSSSSSESDGSLDDDGYGPIINKKSALVYFQAAAKFVRVSK